MTITIKQIDELVKSAVLQQKDATRATSRQEIRRLAEEQGIVLASTQGLYEAAGKGLYHGITVPAMNIRGLTYLMARAVFRAAMKNNVGAFIFEISRGEIGYTKQPPDEYTVACLAAGIREGYKGPVFFQGDHFQFNRARFYESPEKETTAIEALTREAIAAGFLNIDIDASTLVQIDKPTLEEQQANNGRITARMTKFIRNLEPKGVTISVGGEIGEIGKSNSTVADLRAFVKGYQQALGPSIKGISKISVQTGTTHGGVVLPDGSVAKIQLDFNTLEQLSRAAREEFGMGGAVQHGASTLPDEAFDMFPRVNTLEVHLATGFQNITFDFPDFPRSLTETMHKGLAEKYADERKAGETDEQFYYKTRKKAFGDFKKELWGLPEKIQGKIGEALEERFALLFHKLNAVNTVDLVKKYVKV